LAARYEITIVRCIRSLDRYGNQGSPADVPLPLAERLDRLAERLEFPTDAIVQEALDA
jgi:hypothetical protein